MGGADIFSRIYGRGDICGQSDSNLNYVHKNGEDDMRKQTTVFVIL